jgi:serine/threonine-protein kinase
MSSGAGMESMCAIFGGSVYCWGKNAVGQIGDGTLTDRPAPVAVTTNLSGKTVTDISGDAAWSGNVGVVGSTSGGHVCAVASNQAYCWGNNRVNSSSASGEVGIGSTGPYFSTPRAVTTTSMSAPVSEIITGSYHSCAISGGEVFCWGRNNYGQLGNRTQGSVGSSNVPVRVAQDDGVFLNKQVSQLGGGFNRGCGVVDQKTYCWGNNDLGQIGDGTSGNVRDYPTESIFLRPRAPVFLF